MFVLFPRWTEARRRHAEDVARAKMEDRYEGHIKGYIAGYVQGYIQGRNEKQQEWSAWNARRLHAEVNGEPFNEPPPQ